jgi:competence protein ComEC
MPRFAWLDYEFPTPYLPVYLALAVSAGIVAGEQWAGRDAHTCLGPMNLPYLPWLVAVGTVLLGLAWWGRHRRRMLVPALTLFFVMLGAWRYVSHPFEPCFGPDALVQAHAADQFGRPRVMEGVVVGYPVQRERFTQYKVRVTHLWQGETAVAVSGMALVRSDNADLVYGDVVRIRGVPEAPPVFSGFDYRRYLARKGIFTLVRRADVRWLADGQGNRVLAWLYAIRARASAHLNALMPQPYAALANGMILGIESGIPRELYDEFNLTGTSHVIVISGSNIALVSGILLLLFTHLLRGRKKMAALLSLAGIALYTFLVGADAAVVRAAIMGGLYVLAIALNRRSAAIITLFLAAIIMLLLNPLTLWDVGFQLSFMATLGLILFGTPLQRAWDARLGQLLPSLVNNILAEGLLITLAAQITTMPLVVYYFGRLSIISFLANLLIIPVQPPIMIAGGAAIMLAALFQPLGQLIALIPLASLWWTVFVVQKLAAISWGSIEVGSFGRMVAALYYVGFLAGFLWWLWRQEQHARHLIPPRLRPGIMRAAWAAALAISVLWLGTTAFQARADGQLHLRVLGLGDNVAWHITTPAGQHLLLADDTAAAIPLTRVLKFLPAGRAPARLSLAAQAAVSPGTTIALGPDVRLTRLPGPQDETPLFHLQYHNFSMLLPLSNSQAAQEQWLVAGRLPTVTLLVTPWPGSGAWPHPDLLTQIQPIAILQPAGTHYPPGVQATLAQSPGLAGIPNNAITEIISDGQHFQLRRQAYPSDVQPIR